jgi:MoaA/NifB/PqqE/SkfB family radical SAM enzyme
MNNCLYCSSSSGPGESESLPLEQIKWFVREAKKIGLKGLGISGGEPLLYESLHDLLIFLREEGVKAFLYTSGIVGPTHPFVYWRRFEGLLTSISFDLQSERAAIHNRMAGREGALELTVLSIGAAVRAGFECECNMVPTSINLDSVYRLVPFANRLGLSQLIYLRYVPQGRAAENF